MPAYNNTRVSEGGQHSCAYCTAVHTAVGCDIKSLDCSHFLLAIGHMRCNIKRYDVTLITHDVSEGCV